MGKGIVKLGEGNWAVKDGNLLAAKETNGRFKNAEFTVTRGTDATYVGKDGLIANETGDNTPRIDFTDNTDGHLLLEPQSRNIITYSEDFSEWSGNEVTIQTGFLAPDGSNNARKITSTGSQSYLALSGLGLTGTDTRTIYAKTVSGTGTVNLCSYGQNTNNNFTITEDWQRFEVNGTTTTTGQANFYAVDFRFQESNPLSEVIVWGAQAEALSYATSYIPTNGSTVTRDGETCTGAGEAIDFNSEEGVLYAEVAALANSGTVRYLGLNDGSSNNRVVILNDGTANRIRAIVSSGGTKYADLFYNVTDVTDFHKVAVKYKANDFALWIDGVERAIDTSGSAPIGLNDLDFELSGGNFYGKVKAIRVYKEALSDSELTTLTS